MNAIEQAKQGYAPDQFPIQTARSIESKLLGQITAKLTKANGSSHFSDLVEAIYENRRFWTTLAADVADDENQLPENLRAQIFYLAEFTSHQSSLILSQTATADILIEINTSILRGLNGEAITT